MDDVLNQVDYRGYRFELVPDDDASNPLTEFDGAPTLVLHDRAERNFGWTTDKNWLPILQGALDEIAERGVTKKLYGPRGALEIVSRWLKLSFGIPVVLHVSALVHSGTVVYLGAGDHPQDPGGWDSGWIGWLFFTPEQLAERGLPDDPDPGKIEESLRASFAEFAAWVSGDVVGYRIVDAEDEEVHSSYGFYGSDGFTEPDGWIQQEARSFIDAEITSKASA